MALYAIGDLHLPLGADKPMDVFGPRWSGYVEKIKDGFSHLGAEDVCVLCGDLSWAMSMEQARADFEYIDALPGKKVLLKGNHDYWWTTATKAQKSFSDWGLREMDILNNACVEYGTEYAICGTRGWFYEEERGKEHDAKIMRREILRLEASLKQAGTRKKLVFLHYPPKYGTYECREILDLFRDYEVERCYYGHIHGKSCNNAFEGWHENTIYKLVSADYINFMPELVLK